MGYIAVCRTWRAHSNGIKHSSSTIDFYRRFYNVFSFSVVFFHQKCYLWHSPNVIALILVLIQIRCCCSQQFTSTRKRILSIFTDQCQNRRDFRTNRQQSTTYSSHSRCRCTFCQWQQSSNSSSMVRKVEQRSDWLCCLFWIRLTLCLWSTKSTSSSRHFSSERTTWTLCFLFGWSLYARNRF